MQSVLDHGGYNRLGLEVDLGQGEGTRSSSVLVMAKTRRSFKRTSCFNFSFSWGTACLGGGGENESVKETEETSRK